MKTRINKLLLILSIFLYSINYALAQDVKIIESNQHKNRIYGSLGSVGIYGTATVYYERILKQNVFNQNISSFAKVGFGGEGHWGGGGAYVLAQYGLITGTKKHHFELGAGPNFFIIGDFEKTPIPLSGFMGWRFQKLDNQFFCRAGVGWPEAIYFSFGVSF